MSETNPAPDDPRPQRRLFRPSAAALNWVITVCFL
jgi:hypothetical protein